MKRERKRNENEKRGKEREDSVSLRAETDNAKAQITPDSF